MTGHEAPPEALATGWGALRFWFRFGLLLPLTLPQALYTKRHALRLPEAEGPQEGRLSGEGPPLRLVVIGESTVAGVGVNRQEDGLAASIARHWARQWGTAVHWRAHGRNGARIRHVHDHLLPDNLRDTDMIIISIGVNDTTALSPLRLWRTGIHGLVMAIRRQTSAPIRFLALPPMHHFTALPRPLRGVIGHRARLLDHVLRDSLRGLPDCAVLDYATDMHPRYLAEDGYHPSAEGYAAIGEAVAAQLPLVAGTH